MSRKLSKNNTSGATGVSFDSRANKWRAYLTFNNKKIRLGNFSTFDSAVNARKNAELALKSNENWSLISFLHQDKNNVYNRLKLAKLFCAFFSSPSSSHSFLLFVYRNFSSLDLSSIPFSSALLSISYIEKNAPPAFFLYLAGCPLSLCAASLSLHQESFRRSLITFAKKLKNKFAFL